MSVWWPVWTPGPESLVSMLRMSVPLMLNSMNINVQFRAVIHLFIPLIGAPMELQEKAREIANRTWERFEVGPIQGFWRDTYRFHPCSSLMKFSLGFVIFVIL